MKKVIIFLILMIFILPTAISAQDGTLDPRDPGLSPAVEETGSGSAIPTSEPIVSKTAPPAPTPVPSSSLSISPVLTPGPSVSPSPVFMTVDPSASERSDGILILIWSGLAGGGILGCVALLWFKKSGKNKKVDEGKCDSIRELLEQKKKELEETIRNWPKEKITSVAKEVVVTELKKDEEAKRIIETAESLKKKTDKLKETIEMLQKRYDLCILSLPTGERNRYKGTIVENSLKDREILKDLEITDKYQLEDWLLHDVRVNEKQIAKLGETLEEGPWYINFWKEEGDEMIIVFKDKSFKIKPSDKSTWTPAIEYGRLKGIPDEQLDFKVK